MKTTVIAASLLLSSGAAFADQCDVNIDGQLSLINNVLTITTEDNDNVVIQADYQMFINGNTVDLSAEQQEWVVQYYQGITQAVPVVAAIAIDGVELAATALEEVFSNLLGANSQSLSDVTAKLHDLRDDIQYNFYADDGSIQLDSTRFTDGQLLGQQWEAEFEQAIEEVVSSSIGHIMMAIGSELVFGDGDMDDFEQRMETFANDIEYKVESQAMALEQRADALCGQLAQIDYAENKLQSSVRGLSQLNMITVEDHDRKM